MVTERLTRMAVTMINRGPLLLSAGSGSRGGATLKDGYVGITTEDIPPERLKHSSKRMRKRELLKKIWWPVVVHG
jgi:hypothetical protein